MKAEKKTGLGRFFTSREEIDNGRRSGGLAIWIITVLLALIVLGVHLHIRFEIVRLGYATSRARSGLHQLKLKHKALRLEAATLKAPARIEREVRQRLGMDVADHSRIIYVGRAGGTRLASGKVQ